MTCRTSHDINLSNRGFKELRAHNEWQKAQRAKETEACLVEWQAANPGKEVGFDKLVRCFRLPDSVGGAIVEADSEDLGWIVECLREWCSTAGSGDEFVLRATHFRKEEFNKVVRHAEKVRKTQSDLRRFLGIQRARLLGYPNVEKTIQCLRDDLDELSSSLLITRRGD